MSNAINAILEQRHNAATDLVNAIDNLSAKFAALDGLNAQAIEAAGISTSKGLALELAQERLQHMVLTQLSGHSTPAAWGRYDNRYNSTAQPRAMSLSAEVALQNERLLAHIASQAPA